MTSDRTLSARALASRGNAARSRGPEGRGGQGAQRPEHAQARPVRAHTVLLDDEDATALVALHASARAELAPEGPLQVELVRRIAAACRARRADRFEAALLGRHLAGAGGWWCGRRSRERAIIAGPD